MRLSLFLAAVVVLHGSLGSAPAVEPSLQTFLRKHCGDCHGPQAQEGGLRLDTLSTDLATPKTFAAWVAVHDRLQAGEMPPKESAQPTAEERDTVVARLETLLTAADAARRRTAGRSAVRRLNRTEYENTLRDLFDVPALPIRELLPEDGRAFGYDKGADGLELSHVQIAKYLEAADLALDAATAAQIAAPEVVHVKEYPTQRNGFKISLSVGDAVLLNDFRLDESILKVPGAQGLYAATAPGGGVPSLEERAEAGKKKKAALKAIQDDLEAYRGSVGFFRGEGGEFRPHFHQFTVAAEGLYRVRLRLWSFTWNKGTIEPADRQHVVQLRAGPKANERYLGYFDVKSLEPTVIDTVVRLHPGELIGYNATTLRPLALTGPGGRMEWVGQGIAVDWMEVDGPLYDRWPLESHRRAFGDLPLEEMDSNSPLRRPDHTLAVGLGMLKGKARGIAKKQAAWTVASKQPELDAQKLLSDFLPRAFRRPVTKDEVAEYAAIVAERMSENLTFEDGMRWAYKAALCSSDFLFLAEPPGPLNDYALASRLSYFLWNSLPDESLTAAAAAGKLQEPAELRRQVERMLHDPKSERFVADFLDQWLDLAEIDATTPDRKLYPEFSSYLRDSMLDETRQFFRTLLDRDLSVLNVVDSDFAMLNERLALHYGIGGVRGSQLREVKLPADSRRGGMLTQASLLKVTANGTTTTPVKRGAWVMREIVGKPPAPPPPNVPAVEPDVNGTTTIREQLAQHRNDQACAACHAKMDPPGFALENFDVIGGWRTRYRSLGEGEPTTGLEGRQVGYLLGPPVDAAGSLSDGREFADIAGLQKLLLADPDQIARNVIRQLLMYATGAEIGFADRRAVEEILDRVRSQNYGLRTILHEVVQSRLFREK